MEEQAYPIKAQTRFMKILFLQDRSKNKPVLRKSVYMRDRTPEPMYDSAICLVYTSYNTSENREDLVFTTSGKIDRLLRIHPNVESIIHHYDTPYTKRANINTTRETTVIDVAQYYTSFGKRLIMYQSFVLILKA